MANTFVEQDCTFVHEGKEFTSGGASIVDCPDGYRRGVVYAKPNEKPYNSAIITSTGRTVGAPSCDGIVTTWKGVKIASAIFGRTYRGNFCKMRSVSFELAGVKYTGRYCPDGSDAIRVRSTKPVK